MSQTYRDFLSEDAACPGTLYFGGARMALLDIESGFWALRRQMEALVGRRLTDGVLQQAGANGGAFFARSFIAPRASADGAQALRDCVAAYQAAGFGYFEVETLEWPVGRALIRGHDTFEAWMMRQHRQKTESPVCAYTAGVFVGFVNELSERQDVVCVERACQARGDEACLFELLPIEAAGDFPVIAFDPDPLLSHQINLLEVLFDHMPMGIAIFERDLVLRRCNPTWAGYIDRYTPTKGSQVVPGLSLFDLAPGTEANLTPVLERVLGGETVRLEGFRCESGGIVSYWDAVFTPLIEGGKVVGIVDMTTDATGRVLAYQDLEQRVADRTRELSALYDVMAAASESLDLQTVLERSLDRVLKVMGCEVGAIHLLDEAEGVLHLAASQGISSDVATRIDSVLVHSGLAGWTVEHGEPLIVPNLADGPRPLLAVPATDTQTYVGVPVRTRGRALGVLSVVAEMGRQFGEAEMSLLMSIANEVGVAVENARLYQQAQRLAVVKERERLARDLHDSVTQSLYSLTLLSEAGRRLAGAGDVERVEGYLDRLGEIAQQALKEMRLLVYELRPLVLKREGLVGALQQRLDAVEKRAGVDARLLVEGAIELSASVEEALYHIAQEALNNALKHAAATSVTVHVRGEGDRVELEVVDNGTGFDLNTERDRGGMGLVSMRERAEKLGGSLTVLSTPGEGTRVKVGVEVSR
jgi:signal transduction histidine kinase/PAS domain-containing protein